MENTNSQFILFKTEDEKISVDVRFENETVWLTQDQMSSLFDKAKPTISEHIKHIFEEGELDETVVVRNFRITTQHGAIEGKTQQSAIKLYNLDVIISVGYRVKSLRGTQFRQWATKRLNEYIRKGFTMDDERLKNLGGGSYWKELLQRIRDIRASEKFFIVKYWIFIQPVWITTRKRKFLLHFLKKCKIKFIYDKLLLVSKDNWKRMIDVDSQTKVFDHLELANVKTVQTALAKKEKIKGQALIRAYESLKKLKKFGFKI